MSEVPSFELTDTAIDSASLEKLKEFATRAGIGYRDLDEEGLRERLRFHGW